MGAFCLSCFTKRLFRQILFYFWITFVWILTAVYYQNYDCRVQNFLLKNAMVKFKGHRSSFLGFAANWGIRRFGFSNGIQTVESLLLGTSHCESRIRFVLFLSAIRHTDYVGCEDTAWWQGWKLSKAIAGQFWQSANSYEYFFHSWVYGSSWHSINSDASNSMTELKKRRLREKPTQEMKKNERVFGCPSWAWDN